MFNIPDVTQRSLTVLLALVLLIAPLPATADRPAQGASPALDAITASVGMEANPLHNAVVLTR